MENLDNELTAKRAEKKAKHSPTSLPGESSSSSSLTDTSSIDEDAESTELCTSRSRVPKENNQSSDNKNRLKDRSSSRLRSNPLQIQSKGIRRELLQKPLNSCRKWEF